MVKTKQTKRKSQAEKERWEKYKIAKVPSKFGTTAKVATHGPPVLPGRPGSTRNLPDYHGKYFIQSKLNTVYVKVKRNKNTCTCCMLTHVKGVERNKSTCTCCMLTHVKGVERNKNTCTCCMLTHVEGVERNKNTCTCCMLTHVEGVESTCTKCNCTEVIVFNKVFQTK